MNRNGAGAEAAQMVLNENGSLGIGTESPSEDLTIGANKVTYQKTYNGNQLSIISALRFLSGN